MEQREHKRVMQSTTDPTQLPAHRTRRPLKESRDLAMTRPGFGEFEQDLVIARQGRVRSQSPSVASRSGTEAWSRSPKRYMSIRSWLLPSAQQPPSTTVPQRV
jgi:hypothetical protein